MAPKNGAAGGWIGLAAALAVFVALVARSSFLIDDAYISFRYAANWAETGVPTFDATQPPVEGYSNLLWVVLLRACCELGLDLEVWSRVLSIACGGWLIVALHRFLVRELQVGPRAAGLACVALASFPPFVTWCTGGLESALFAALVFGAFAALVRSGAPGRERRLGLAAGVCGAGVVLVRAEGLLWAAALGTCALLARRLGGAPVRTRLFAYASVTALAAVGLVAWRQSVYGEWVANTVHAKAALSGAVLARGAKTVASYLVLFVSPLVGLAAALAVLRPGRRAGAGAAAAVGAAGLFLVFLTYNILVGGDWMPMFRFLAPASPFLALLLATLFDRLGGGRALALGGVLVGLQVLPLFGLSAAPAALREALYFRTFRVGYETEWARWERGERNRIAFRAIGLALAHVAKPGESLTLGPIGAIGYFSGMTLHDRNGLVDAEVARRPMSRDPVAGDEGTTGGGTAGHDRRVPRAWFLPRAPTYFEALLWPSTMTGAAWPGLAAAARSAMGAIQNDAAERPLLEHCVGEAHELPPSGAWPPGATLLLLRRTDDPAEARAFWGR